jgi:hypothetical protein
VEEKEDEAKEKEQAEITARTRTITSSASGRPEFKRYATQKLVNQTFKHTWLLESLDN